MVETEKRRYGHSLLGGMDFNAVSKRLTMLMDHDKIYRNENISLGSLAEALSITHHQLSQLLNERFKMNFSTFINSYRIRDAKKIIIEEPESSIISVAYVVGFNSKTAFYRAFDKVTGMTPQKYRDEILVKS
jgi:YesN/AraC family two-component response regulator